MSSSTPPEQPIAGSAGIEIPAAAPPDPLAALDDLMSVVEALCPSWPYREPFVSAGPMLL